MAIPVLSNLDLQNSGQIIKFRVENAAASGYSGAQAGALIYDSGNLKFYNGSSFVTLGTGSGSGTVTQVDGGAGLTGSVTSSGSLAVGAGTGITVNADDVAVTATQTGITSVYNSSLAIGHGSSHANIDFGTDNQINFDIDGTAQIVLKDGALEPVTDDDVDLGSSTKQFKNLYIDGTAEVDALTIGGVTSVPFESGDHTKLDGIESNATADQTDSEIKTAYENNSDTNAFTDALLSKLNAIEASADVTDTTNVASSLNASLGGAATFGDSSDTITVPGNLKVTGDTTYSNETIKIVEDNKLAFRAGDGNNHEVILTASDATADRTVTMANLSGHVALLASAPGGTISATPAELNIMDGVTATTAELNILDGVTSTASELNILDGVTASTNELNIMDGVTSTTAELNILDGVTSTTAELNILDGVTSTAAELNILDGVTANATELNLLDGITTLSGSNTGDESDASASVKGIVELATVGEVQAGTDASRAITADTLAAKSVVAQIDVSSLNATALKAVINHGLDTKDIAVEVFGATTGERVLCEYHTDNNGSSSTGHLTFHFVAVPSEDLNVKITSIKGATSKTPTYPSS